MFWTGIIIGIFIGAAVGILVMSMAISAGNASQEERCVPDFGIEPSNEVRANLREKTKENL